MRMQHFEEQKQAAASDPYQVSSGNSSNLNLASERRRGNAAPASGCEQGVTSLGPWVDQVQRSAKGKDFKIR